MSTHNIHFHDKISLKNWFLLHLLGAGCDIGVCFSMFDIYVKVNILINYKTKQPSNLA